MPASYPTIVQLPPMFAVTLQEAADAADPPHTIQAEILKRLAKSLDMEYVPPKRGRPWPKKV